MRTAEANVSPTPSYVIQGRTVTMPAIVRDASTGNAIFVVPAQEAQRLVGDGYTVVEMMPGQTQLVLGFVDYRDNDLGDYNEVMIVFMVRPSGQPDAPEGTFIYKLPVNQSFTCDAGRTIWGFPKSVERVEIAYTGDHATCRLEMGGRLVFSLTVPCGRAESGEAPDLEMTTYTYLSGRSAVRFTTGGATAVSPGPDGVVLELGAHPIADELRQLGLPAPAMMSTWNAHMHGSFDAPQAV
jgi:hypothetical protein